nr:MAG TPA: hypothetical protein [Caudoviricetes sp.]
MAAVCGVDAASGAGEEVVFAFVSSTGSCIRTLLGLYGGVLNAAGILETACWSMFAPIV